MREKMSKRRILSMFLIVSLLCGMLPIHMLVGVAKVKAKEVDVAENIFYEGGEWTVSSKDSAYETRTVEWDLTTAGLASSKTLAVGDLVKGIIINDGKVALKKETEGLSLYAGGSILIPLDSETTSVDVTFMLTGKNDERYFTVGGSTQQRVFHGKSHEEYDPSIDGLLEKIDSMYEYSGSYDSSYFTDGYLEITGFVGENKFGKIILTESRPISQGEDSGEDNEVPKVDPNHHTYDVWDFGAEQLTSTEHITYNNKLNEDFINSWFEGEPAGTTGVTIPGDLIYTNEEGEVEFRFNTGGFNSTHRYRTKNENLTRYDVKSLTNIDNSSIVYNGYLYSNKSATADVNVQLLVKAGDIVTFVVSSNGGGSELVWKSPNGVEEVKEYSGKSSQAKEMTFYAAEDGMYTLYSKNEKLVVARILRERPRVVTVKGNVEIPSGADLSKASLVFTNDKTGAETVASIKDGSYSVRLSEQYNYSISLEGANGYIVGDADKLTLGNGVGDTKFDIDIVGIDLIEVRGSLVDLTEDAAKNLVLRFEADGIYVPEVTINPEDCSYTAKLEKGVTYIITESGVNDYNLETTTIKMDASGTADIKFTKKPVYPVSINLVGPSQEESAKAKITFTNINEEGYVYTYTGTEGIALRDGQYKVEVELDGYSQQPTADVKVAGAEVANKTIKMKSTKEEPAIAYKSEITVGEGQEYKTINEALEAVRKMDRSEEDRVTIFIEPGNYEEMLVIDVDNVTLKNAADVPSLDLKDKGVNIEEGAVRITFYYGHGYTYYSMDSNCKYNEELLAVNKENGYASFVNPGAGVNNGSYWNATVTVLANGFEAEGIIFENSFNQYVSAKATEDIIVAQDSAKEGSVKRADMEYGDVTVQDKAYVERAAALAIGNNYSDIYFKNCKFVGRQDTLYGGRDTYVEFDKCSIYGGTDYIFGGMIAIFNECNLVFNTSDDKNDVGYITAAQQNAGRGYLMYECKITSTTPGLDTASKYPSKPGYLGRPWAANTSEVVFYKTTIVAAHDHWVDADSSISKTSGKSLIISEGWDRTLGGESSGMQEYGTEERASDYTPNRVGWATVLTEPVLNDGTPITIEAFRKVESEIKDYYDINLTAGLEVGTPYDGGISVLENMPYKTIDGDVVGGVTYTGYVVGSSNPLAEDGKGANGRIPVTGAVIKLEAIKDGKLKVAIKLGSDKTLYFVDEATGEYTSHFNSTSSSEYIDMIYEVEEGKTYYLYGGGTKPSIYSIVVDYRQPEDWDKIDKPVLLTPVVDGKEGTITVPFTAKIGNLYADALEVRMLLDGEVVDTITYSAESESASVEFKPQASGSYSFQAILKRGSEAGKYSNKIDGVKFTLPLAKPEIINVENQGEGNIRFSWKAVPEAESYKVYIDEEFKEEVKVPFARFAGLTPGKSYEFAVEAVRGEDISTRASIKQTVTEEAMKTWSYAAFGSGVDTKNNGYSGSIETGDLTLWSMSGKGKIVPASTDGLAFYYTTIDPETENFTLSADITVDTWTLSNGQEGFGLMAADAVGTDGDSSTFWNNSYMASVTKVEYLWDYSKNAITDTGDNKYTMKLGIGSQEKKGVTPENIADGTTVNYFSSKMTTLDTDAASSGLPKGTYNSVGNYTNEGVDLGDVNLQTTFRLTIQRNNTGYFISYTDEDGNVTTNKYYHGDDGDELTKLDPHNIYLGFFASRNVRIKIDNVELTTIHPDKDAPAQERPITYVTPKYEIESAEIANSSSYEIVYYGNADGLLTIKGPKGIVVDKKRVEANKKFRVDTILDSEKNEFTITFTPNQDYIPSKYERLSSYETKVFKHEVTFRKHMGDVIYVSPKGTNEGSGTKDSPMDIYTAVKFAVPGQKILLTEGPYNLTKRLVIERGINGSPAEFIYLMADPNATSRPVLDFNQECEGIILAGDYWYLQGFDVTGSKDGQKGLQVSGNHNVLDLIRAYKNGNSGIQISRYKVTDTPEEWPSHNLVLNCTSFLNADAGYEDADGFAAKLTIGEGNVFDGCIAAYNADDGWDLFAKVETGPIGVVEIRNSVAYKNGYILDDEGNEINAGNGNGFKMGGSSITGPHILKNSVAFANKAKGIDSNSGPDIRVYNSTSFDNESYNVALYTNDARNTDFIAEGILSFKQSNTVAEQLKLLGSQDKSKVQNETNYFFNGTVSENTKGIKVDPSWFISLDTQKAIDGGITRNADGTINLNGYLELSDKAPLNTGARMGGTASRVIEVKEQKTADTIKDLTKGLEEVIKSGDNIKIEQEVEYVLGRLDTIIGLDKITLSSTEVLNQLKDLEKVLEENVGMEVKIEDNQSKIKCATIDNALLSIPAKGKAVLKVSDVAKTKELEEVVRKVVGDKNMNTMFFDLSLYSNNEKVSLNVPVKVTLKVPSDIDLSKSPVLIHIMDDGTSETLPYTVKGDEISFVTSSFSIFILSSEVDQATDQEDSKDTNKPEEDNKQEEEKKQEDKKTETDKKSTDTTTGKSSNKKDKSKGTSGTTNDSPATPEEDSTGQDIEDSDEVSETDESTETDDESSKTDDESGKTDEDESDDTEDSADKDSQDKAEEVTSDKAVKGSSVNTWVKLLGVLVVAGISIVTGVNIYKKSKKKTD